MRNTRNLTLPSKAHWFQSQILSAYHPPHTIHPDHLIGPSPLLPSTQPHAKHSPISKGFRFLQTKRQSPFACHDITPGPSQYLKSQSLQKSSRKGSKEQSKKKLGGQRVQVVKVGVGQYELGKEIIKKSFNSGQTMGRAEKNNYFTNVEHQTYYKPGPGYYLPQKLQKSQSVTHTAPPNNSQQKQKKASSSEKKGVSKGRVLGPCTYEVNRPAAVSCSAVLKVPYQEKDEDIRKRVTELRSKKKDDQNTGPGKYLRIEEWGRFDKSKPVPNRLKICSKPSLSVYH